MAIVETWPLTGRSEAATASGGNSRRGDMAMVWEAEGKVLPSHAAVPKRTCHGEHPAWRALNPRSARRGAVVFRVRPQGLEP